MKRRWLEGSALVFTVLSGAYVGCTDDPPADVPESDGGTAPDVAPVDASVEDALDGGADAEACSDLPIDCSATEGNTGVDDAGPSEESGAAARVPIHLRCAGLYRCWSSKRVASDHREYEPAFTLWSDGAEKTRWLFLPPGATIATSSASGVDGGTPDDWIYPVGTMAYKEFRLAGKRVETRRIWKASATEWVYSVWRWSEDETDAILTHAGALLPNPNPDAQGRPYEIPTTAACATCHDGHVDKLLSLDAWSLAAGAKGITLQTLKEEGRLSGWDHPTTFAVPQDGTGLFDRAVGFYYNNCGFCHKPGGAGSASGLQLYLPVAAALPGTGADAGLPDGGAGLRFEETPVYKTAVDVAHINPLGAMFPLGTFKRITPGDAELSVLPKRDALRDPDGGTIVLGQMPNMLQRTFDPDGVGATRAWIDALQP